jgi:predicted transporter
MKGNIGNADRLIRIIIGLLIIGVGVYFKSWWGLLGVIPIVFAVIGWCPLYVPFGISTRRK